MATKNNDHQELYVVTLHPDVFDTLKDLQKLPLNNLEEISKMMKENIKLQKLVDSVMTNEQRDFHDEIT